MIDRGNLFCQEIRTLCMDFFQVTLVKKLAELAVVIIDGGLTFFITVGAAQTAEEP